MFRSKAIKENVENVENLEKIYSFAKDITSKASKLILNGLTKTRQISFKKGHHNLVTNVDREVEALVIKEIISRFPNHTIIAEESGIHEKDKSNVWFIDPIDGTTNFAHGYPCFCISIGFAKNGKLEFGLVMNPVTNELYSAKKGKGAKLNGKPINVSRIKTLKESLLITGFSQDSKKSKQRNFNRFKKLTILSQGVRRDGSAAMDLCYVASGKLDGFWEQKLNVWDVAAGVLILKEAGGKVTNYEGKEFDMFKDNIVATNGFIHKELLNELS